MTSQRQQAFQQLRDPCVELSAIALQFKGKQASIKQVLRALRTVHDALRQLGDQTALDPKLAEYAFFPLTHIFNESQRLSSACLETAIHCVIVLVSKGWRQNIAPEMGKQLLILMSLLAGGDPRRSGEPPSDDLKATSFNCIGAVVQQMTTTENAQHLFDDVSTQNIVDQLVYILLEAITDSPSDHVQLAAASASSELTIAISNRVLLASLLPRTTSSLTKALRPSTQARRTGKVLTSYLNLLTATLRAVLADNAVFNDSTRAPLNSGDDAANSDALDDSWLRATTPQVHTALTQIVRLQTHAKFEVRQALADLCLMVIEECTKSLSNSLPLMVDTLASLAQHDDSSSIASTLRSLMTSRPETAEVLRSKLYDWSQALPRIMQGSDNRPKRALLGQIASAVTIAAENLDSIEDIVTALTTSLLNSLVNTECSVVTKQQLIEARDSLPLTDLKVTQASGSSSFPPLLLNTSTHRELSESLQKLFASINRNGLSNRMTRILVDRIPNSSPAEQIAAIWLSIICLKQGGGQILDLNTFIDLDMLGDDGNIPRPYLVSDLYSLTLPFLLEEDVLQEHFDWRLKALALECTVLQAEQLEKSYRPELLDTLYPVVSLLGSNNEQLRIHAMTSLDLLAAACDYPSARDMLMGNVDYLINAVGMKLNAFDISPQAPQVLLMMVRLCGARIIPYLDDLIGSIFAALDNFHGYPTMVELLFQVLMAVVDESKAQPQLAVSGGVDAPSHKQHSYQSSTIDDIVSDLRKRRSRKRKFNREYEDMRTAPREPWVSPNEGAAKNAVQQNEAAEEMEEYEPSADSTDKDEKKKLSKPHQLLLSIAQATSPHLASPSPQVRQILLQLLDEVSPLLARDENTFLPLINSIWPALVPRLFAPIDENDRTEASYNVCAAAVTMATLCKGAGSFMASRIEDVFPELERLFYQVQFRAESRSTKEARSKSTKPELSPAVRKPSIATTLARSAALQILIALTSLLSTVISFVRVTDDNGDKIMCMLAPYSDVIENSEVKEALSRYSSDALWLWKHLSQQAPLAAKAG